MDKNRYARLCYTIIDYFNWVDYYEGKKQHDDVQRVKKEYRKVLAEMRQMINDELKEK